MAFTKGSGIYAIVNKANGKRYVGSAVDLEQRYRQHHSMLLNGKHYNNHLQNAYNKYGRKSFRFYILLYCDKELLITFEQLVMDQRAEYNMLPTAGSPLGRIMTAEHLVNLRAARKKLKGIPRSEATKAKISASHKGKPKSPEHRAKTAANNRKRCKGIPSPLRGIPRSAEVKAKLSAAAKGKPLTDAQRAYHAGRKGKPWTLAQYESHGLTPPDHLTEGRK